MHKYYKILIMMSIFSLCSLTSFAEDITVTTYYPSPFGNYNELTTAGNTYLATAGGNVGIGTTSPSSKLDVNGWGQFVSPDSGSTGGVRIVAPASGNPGYLQFTNNARNAEWADIAANSSGQLLINSGNVGIGTAVPGYKLDVAGDIIARNGWIRTACSGANCSNGWYNETYGGGWFMSEPTWIRSYGSKYVYIDQVLAVNGGISVGAGGTIPPANGMYVVGNVGLGITPSTGRLEISATAAGQRAITAYSLQDYAIYAVGSGSLGIYGQGVTSGLYGYGSTGVSGSGTWEGVYGAGDNRGGTFIGTSYGVYSSGGTYDFLGGGGEYASSGVWTDTSDRNMKENFTSINEEVVLEKISQLPISQWNYKIDKNKAKHMGPMGQDFYKLFGLGDDDKHTSSLDRSGVALAGTKALYKKLQNQADEIKELRKEIELLKKRQ